MSTVGFGAVMVVTAPCTPASCQCHKATHVWDWPKHSSACDPGGMHRDSALSLPGMCSRSGVEFQNANHTAIVQTVAVPQL